MFRDFNVRDGHVSSGIECLEGIINVRLRNVCGGGKEFGQGFAPADDASVGIAIARDIVELKLRDGLVMAVAPFPNTEDVENAWHEELDVKR